MSFIIRQEQATRDGSKTETRRVVKEGETWDAERQAVLTPAGRIKWQVGRTYAVVPKMYQSRFGNLRILAIEQQLLHDIGGTSALLEGVLAAPLSMTLKATYYVETLPLNEHYNTPRNAYIALWQSINGKSTAYRWSANPRVWVVRFEYLGDVEQ